MIWLVAALVALQFAHYPFSGDLELYIGWSAGDLTIAILSFWCTALIKDTRLKTIMFVFSAWQLVIFGWNLVYIEPAAQTISIAIEAAIFILWLTQQIFILPLPNPDKINDETYFILLQPVKNWLGILNSVRPANHVLHNGKAIYGDGVVWQMRNNKIVRRRLRSPITGDFVAIDTKIKISKEHNDRLDDLIGRPFIPFISDCAALGLGVNLRKLIKDKEHPNERQL